MLRTSMTSEFLEEATVHFQWRRTLHFLQKHTFENYLIFIPTYVNRTCEIQVSWRSEAQTVSKIQVENVFVKAAKFTSLKMYSSLLVFISKKSDVIDVLSMLSWNGEMAYSGSRSTTSRVVNSVIHQVSQWTLTIILQAHRITPCHCEFLFLY